MTEARQPAASESWFPNLSTRCGRAARPVILLFALGIAGCGDDDAPATKPDAGVAGKAGSAGASGNAGAAGSAGAAGANNAPMPVECGTAMCWPPSNPLSGLAGAVPGLGAALPMSAACCLDPDSGKCGLSPMAGGTCEAPAVSDSRCPGLSLGALGAIAGGLGGSMSGCCIDDQCGLDGALFGRGCVENSQARSQLSAIPLLGTLVMAPGSLACDRPITTPPDHDAGPEDAGI
jgi:hypothetical protein